MIGGRVVLDADRLLSHLDAVEKALDQLRAYAAEGFRTNDQPVGDYDLDAINWLTRDKSPAGPDEAWAWSYAYGQDGGILPETQGLVEDLSDSPSARVVANGYEITLSKGRFLNRKRI